MKTANEKIMKDKIKDNVDSLAEGRTKRQRQGEAFQRVVTRFSIEPTARMAVAIAYGDFIKI
jgi:hypothetical protein